MKKIIPLIFAVFCINNVIAQTLSSGSYSSSELGYTYTVSVKQEGITITITEPNRVNLYKSNGGDTYYHTEEKYAEFYIRVAGDNKYYTGKQGKSKEYLFTLSGENTDSEQDLPSGIENCPLYDKYLNLSKTDHVNTQAWAFCGAAALAKCTYKDATGYLKPLIESLKLIIEDGSKCPCTDAITQAEWNAVK